MGLNDGLRLFLLQRGAKLEGLRARLLKLEELKEKRKKLNRLEMERDSRASR